MSRRAARLLLVMVAGCSASGGGGSGGGDSPTKSEPGWTPFLLQSWKAAPGEELQQSYGSTADRDTTITAIRAVDPPGTHHVDVLGPGPWHNLLFVSVIGTGPFSFPDGVGLRVRKGDALTLELHVVNTSADVLRGASGLEVIEADPSTAIEEANILNPALTELTLPPGTTTKASGTCTVTGDQTFFAIGPHMHELGSHFKSTLTQNGRTRVLLDEDFTWNEQAFVPLERIAVHAGDTVNLECTWINTTPNTVHWGTTSDQEMCSAFVYRYPAGDGGFCTQ